MFKKNQPFTGILLAIACSTVFAQEGELIALSKASPTYQHYLKPGCTWSNIYTDSSGSNMGLAFTVATLSCDNQVVLYKKNYIQRIGFCNVYSPAPGYTLTGRDASNGKWCADFALYKNPTPLQ